MRAVQTESKQVGFVNWFRRHWDVMMPLMGLILLLVVAGIAIPGFLSINHIADLSRKATALIFVSIGQTLVIMLGNGSMDVSVGALITLVNVIAVGLLSGGLGNLVVVSLLCIAIGLLVGMINGLVIRRLRTAPFIVTLGTMSILTGLALLYTKGAPRGSAPSLLRYVATGRIGGLVPISTLIWVGIALVIHYFMAHTVFGRRVRATGDNAVAAYFSGIRVDNIWIVVYSLSGGLAAVAGLILTGYIGSGSLGIGAPYMFDSVIAAVLGGASFAGGKGNVGGAIIGALILTILVSFLTVLNIAEAGRSIMQGLILILILLWSSRPEED